MFGIRRKATTRLERRPVVLAYFDGPRRLDGYVFPVRGFERWEFVVCKYDDGAWHTSEVSTGHLIPGTGAPTREASMADARSQLQKKGVAGFAKSYAAARRYLEKRVRHIRDHGQPRPEGRFRWVRNR
jgi:hypothetical protein